MKKEVKSSARHISIFLTVVIIVMLVLVGPAWAFSLKVVPSQDFVNKGDEISFIVSLDVGSEERLPVEYLELDIGSSRICRFNPNGEKIVGCDAMTISRLSSTDFDEGNLTGSFHGFGYDFGYGYGYGRGYQSLSYNITVNSTVLGFGLFTTKLKVKMLSDLRVFEEFGGNVSIIERVSIFNESISDDCVLEQEEFQVAAEIIGSIEEVFVLWSNGNSSGNVSLGNKGAGEYKYIFNSSLIYPGEFRWRFVARNVAEELVYGLDNVLVVKHRTFLEVVPESPTGLNGWYLAEPTFILTNPDGNISYRWDGEPFMDYVGSFGLEDVPNNGNVTGGVHALRYKSDVCGEGEREFVGKFDFTNPRITHLSPAPGAVVYDTRRPVISAFLDEVYHSNSGIDKDSVVMTVDGAVVQPELNSSGDLDLVVQYIPLADLSFGTHSVSLSARDNAGRHSSFDWEFETDFLGDFNLTINEPREAVYNNKRVQFNLTVTREVDKISYINYDDGKPRTNVLCTNCAEYGEFTQRLLTMHEGLNRVKFIAADKSQIVEEEVSFFVDSKKPTIIRTSPQTGFADGRFYAEFREENPEYVAFKYGNVQTGFRNRVLNISEDCVYEKNNVCDVWVDLSDYDSQQIVYSFNVTDVAGNSVESRERKLNVDITPPLINSLNQNSDRRRVHFVLNVTEKNLNKITYIDYSESRLRERSLCTRLNGQMCEKTVLFSDGEHNVEIRAVDRAGNSVNKNISFFIDSKKPNIRKVSPIKGFASGKFYVDFREDNPVSLILHYGNLETGMNMQSVDIGGCINYAGGYECLESVDLADYDGQDIMYWFELSDAKNRVESRRIFLEVDTIAPVLTNPDSFWEQGEGRYTPYVYFQFDVVETNFDRISYVDRGDSVPREKMLCSRLKNGVCEVRKQFGKGNHNLTISIRDKAGNSIEEEIYFFV